MCDLLFNKVSSILRPTATILQQVLVWPNSWQSLLWVWSQFVILFKFNKLASVSYWSIVRLQAVYFYLVQSAYLVCNLCSPALETVIILCGISVTAMTWNNPSILDENWAEFSSGFVNVKHIFSMNKKCKTQGWKLVLNFFFHITTLWILCSPVMTSLDSHLASVFPKFNSVA
jgi:hypothetical protein